MTIFYIWISPPYMDILSIYRPFSQYMNHPVYVWTIISGKSLLYIDQLLCIWTIFSVHRPSSVHTGHPFSIWTNLSLCRSSSTSIHGPSSLYMDYPLHGWTILFKHGSFSQCINHLFYIRAILSVHGSSSPYMEYILSMHVPCTNFALYTWTIHSIHRPSSLIREFTSLFMGNTLCSGNLFSLHGPATLCLDLPVYTQTILSIHISYPFWSSLYTS